jgi:uncharacterized surface protein with fasciclin (FAS1) repeats
MLPLPTAISRLWPQPLPQLASLIPSKVLVRSPFLPQPTMHSPCCLPAGTVDGLLEDIPKLTAILKYHVLAGKVAAADVMKLDGKTATTLNGADLKVSTTGGVKLNGKVNVTKTDVAASNGLIHVIDAVLLPSA